MADMDIDDIINNLRAEDDDISEEYESVDLSSPEDLNDLKRLWIAERMAPDILSFEQGLLDRIMNRVRRQMDFIEDKTMENQPEGDMKFKLLVMESELERVKFLVRGYLRARLMKIDKYTAYIRKSENSLLTRLSSQEVSYMETHYNLLKELYRSQFLDSLPETLQSLEDTVGEVSMIESPDLDRAVFIRVLKPVVEPVQAGNDQVELERGSIYVLRYSTIASLIQDGSVELV